MKCGADNTEQQASDKKRVDGLLFYDSNFVLGHRVRIRLKGKLPFPHFKADHRPGADCCRILPIELMAGLAEDFSLSSHHGRLLNSVSCHLTFETSSGLKGSKG